MKSYILKIGDVDVFVEKKKIKNMYLKAVLKENAIKISAPYYTSDKQIRDFALERQYWIEENKRKMNEKNEKINEKKYCLFGEVLEKKINVTDSNFGVERVNNTLIFNVAENYSEEQTEDMYYGFLKDNFEEALPHFLWECENLSGLKANSYKLRKMNTRWGSCSVKSRDIRFSVKLAEKNDKCIKYVIYHELCHLVVPCHDRRFYALLSKFCPDWKKLKDDMKV